MVAREEVGGTSQTSGVRRMLGVGRGLHFKKILIPLKTNWKMGGLQPPLHTPVLQTPWKEYLIPPLKSNPAWTDPQL